MTISMNAFAPCASCRCLVKSTDAACPFCGAEQLARAPRRGPGPRQSRAVWLAFGGALATMSSLACGSSSSSDDASSQQLLFCVDGANAKDPNFTCGERTCDPATQYCAHKNYSCSNDGEFLGCDDYACKPLKDIPSCASGSLPSGDDCAILITPDGSQAAELITYAEVDAPCGSANAGCYGAPPARLERA
jgi:hypothetical protein